MGEPVFRRVVFIFVLADETTAGEIIGPPLTTSLKFDLKPAKKRRHHHEEILGGFSRIESTQASTGSFENTVTQCIVLRTF